jgi:hypothetical protein
VIASALTEREITLLQTLTVVVVVVVAIAVTAHLASTKIIRKLAGDTEIADPPHLGLSLGMIGKSVLQGLRQGEINKQKLPEKLLTAIYINQRIKVESIASLRSLREKNR